MSKMHHIYEDDLVELERIIPELCLSLYSVMDNRLRRQLRQCKTILSNVRWNYGPPEHVESVDGEDVEQDEYDEPDSA